MNREHNDFTPEDIASMARNFCKPVPETLRNRVMEGLDQIDRDRERGIEPKEIRERERERDGFDRGR